MCFKVSLNSHIVFIYVYIEATMKQAKKLSITAVFAK